MGRIFKSFSSHLLPSFHLYMYIGRRPHDYQGHADDSVIN